MTECKLHRRQEQLCRSHIIPAWCYREMFSDSGMPILFSCDGSHPKRRPQGVYDDTIMCAEADNLIGKFDAYACRLFTRDISLARTVLTQGRKFSKIDDFDYRSLAIFVMSLVWRTHHSQELPCRSFSVGCHYEGVLREAILNEKSEIGRCFSFLVAHYDDPVHLVPLRFPRRHRVSGHNCAVCYILNYKVVVFLDQRGPPDGLEPVLARPGKPLLIPTSSYLSSTEFFSVLGFLEKTAAAHSARAKSANGTALDH